MKCKVDSPEAKVKWFKDGKEIKPSDPRFLIKNEGGFCTLEIRSAELGDAGEYKCVIQDFGKEGDSETTCQLEVDEFQHAFTSDLQGKNVVEDETAVFELGVEEDDAPVKWFKDGKEIIPDGKRIQIVAEGKKRKLIIKNCKLEDAGMITAKTIGDERSAPLGVKCKYFLNRGPLCDIYKLLSLSPRLPGLYVSPKSDALPVSDEVKSVTKSVQNKH